MSFQLLKTEPYPSELPATPPTPHPSPTLGNPRLHTLSEQRLPKDGDAELRSLTFCLHHAFSLPKNTKVTRKYVPTPSNTQRQAHPNSIDLQTQDDAPYHGRDQQRYDLAPRSSRERPAPNDVGAWWGDTNTIRTTTQTATSASILLDLGQTKASRRTSGQAAVR